MVSVYLFFLLNLRKYILFFMVLIIDLNMINFGIIAQWVKIK